MEGLELPSALYPFKSSSASNPASEWTAIFETASDLILGKADRASLVVFLSDMQGDYDSFASFIGMLPFRGVATALVSFNNVNYGSLQSLSFRSPSGVFQLNASDSARMGICPVSMVFGPLPQTVFAGFSEPWDPFPATTDEQVPRSLYSIFRYTYPPLYYKLEA